MDNAQEIKKYLVPEPKRIQTAIEYILKRNEKPMKIKIFPKKI